MERKTRNNEIDHLGQGGTQGRKDEGGRCTSLWIHTIAPWPLEVRYSKDRARIEKEI